VTTTSRYRASSRGRLHGDGQGVELNWRLLLALAFNIAAWHEIAKLFG
jgi:hypothetical protein